MISRAAWVRARSLATSRGVSCGSSRSRAAAARTVPFAMLCQSILILWYHHAGTAATDLATDLATARACAPGSATSATPASTTCGSPSTAPEYQRLSSSRASLTNHAQRRDLHSSGGVSPKLEMIVRDLESKSP
jgi:hypothetical protein